MGDEDEERASLQRRISDMQSGIALVRDDFPGVAEEELEKSFAAFKQYDIDDSGFITPENLKAIMDVMELGVTMDDISGMIDEVRPRRVALSARARGAPARRRWRSCATTTTTESCRSATT